LREEFPEIAEFARLHNLGGDPNIVSRTVSSSGGSETAGQTLAFYESRVFYADPAFLRIFSFPLVRGDAATALEEPGTAVLTESLARKYFRDEDPFGQTVMVTIRFGRFLEIIGLFTLLLAWVKFINLATARSLHRGESMGHPSNRRCHLSLKNGGTFSPNPDPSP
jgi:hypothetical protein